MGSSICLSLRRRNEMGSLWTQLLLQFLTDLFETLQVFLSWSEDVHLVLGLSSCYLFINFFHFFYLIFFFFFSGKITIRIDTLSAQLLLEFSPNQFETMLIFYLLFRHGFFQVQLLHVLE